MFIRRYLAGASLSMALAIANPAYADLLGGSANGALNGTLSGRMGDIGGMADGRATGSIGAQTDAIDRVGQRTGDIAGRAKNRTESTANTARDRSRSTADKRAAPLRGTGSRDWRGWRNQRGLCRERRGPPSALHSSTVRAVLISRSPPASRWRPVIARSMMAIGSAQKVRVRIVI
jgi:hypothetical protein